MKYLKTFEGSEDDYEVFKKIKEELEHIKYILEDDNIEFGIRYRNKGSVNRNIIGVIDLKNKNKLNFRSSHPSNRFQAESDTRIRDSYIEWRDRLYNIIEEENGLKIRMNTFHIFLIMK